MRREIGHLLSMRWKDLEDGDVVVPDDGDVWMAYDCIGLDLKAFFLEEGRFVIGKNMRDDAALHNATVLRCGKNINK